jgi:hypothetical protein
VNPPGAVGHAAMDDLHAHVAGSQRIDSELDCRQALRRTSIARAGRPAPDSTAPEASR